MQYQKSSLAIVPSKSNTPGSAFVRPFNCAAGHAATPPASACIALVAPDSYGGSSSSHSAEIELMFCFQNEEGGGAFQGLSLINCGNIHRNPVSAVSTHQTIQGPSSKFPSRLAFCSICFWQSHRDQRPSPPCCARQHATSARRALGNHPSSLATPFSR